MPETKPIKKSLPWIYMVSYATQSFGTAIQMSFLTVFLTDFMLMSTTMMATILTVTRFFDLVVSLVAGAIVQKSNFKWGQFRSWLLILPTLLFIGNVLCFLNPPGTPLVQALVVGVGYLLFNGCMNFLVTAYNGLMTKIVGPNMDARMALSAKMMQGMNLGTLLTSVMTAPLIKRMVGQNLNGYLILSVIYGIIFFVGCILLFNATREYDQHDPNAKSASSGVKLTTMYIETLKNPMVIVLICTNVLSMLGMFVMMSMMMYYYIYSIGDMDMQAVAQSISMFVGLGAAFVMPPLGRKLGKKNSAIVSSLLAVVFMALNALFANGNLPMYIVFASLNTIGAALLGSMGVNLWLDAAEYQLYKTGKDNRPFAMSLSNVPMKIGMMLSAPLVAVILGQAGYQQDAVTRVTTLSDPGRMVFLMFMFTAATSLLNALIYAFGYRITDAKAREYAEHNQRVMNEKMAAASAAPQQ